MPQVILNIKTNCMSDPDKAGRMKTIKKNILTRISVNSVNIKNHFEIYDVKGKVINKECRILLDTGQELIVSHSFDSITNLIKPLEIKGFRK